MIYNGGWIKYVYCSLILRVLYQHNIWLMILKRVWYM